MNTTCNSTLDDLRIGSEIPIAGPFTFHQLALIIGGGCTAIAILSSFYLMWRHALNYTKPREQKHIIRILFMVPVYSASSFLCIWYYWHAVYFQVISDCYEAFAISSFFALLCHYVGPDLHDQKDFFRNIPTVTPWVLPINWFAKCCGGQRGIWRTPKSGLTWFNIIWIGIYQYCFIRVAMTITAVVTQYFAKYCESSNSPVFAHIWVLVIESLAVTVAMYCVIQFYVQLREPLAEHKPFLKVLAIKLVIFLSFWQSTAISLGTSTLHLVSPNEALAYPDIKIGFPSLLLCFEMACFAILHLWAFPYQPYVPSAKHTFYPVSDPSSGMPPQENEHSTPQGGFLGLKAFGDALNIWDVVKAFGRGMRWLFVGVKNRHTDADFNKKKQNHNSLDTEYPMKPYGLKPGGLNPDGIKSTDHLPIAQQFRQSTFYTKSPAGERGEESAGLIDHAQGFSTTPPRRDASPYHDPQRAEYYEASGTAAAVPPSSAFHAYQPYSEATADPGNSAFAQAQGAGTSLTQKGGNGRANPRNSTQMKVGNALWGDRSQQDDWRLNHIEE